VLGVDRRAALRAEAVVGREERAALAAAARHAGGDGAPVGVRLDGVGQLAHLPVDLGDLGGAPGDDLGLCPVRSPARVEHERAQPGELVGPRLAQPPQPAAQRAALADPA
jgi:hypothetical protein